MTSSYARGNRYQAPNKRLENASLGTDALSSQVSVILCHLRAELSQIELRDGKAGNAHRSS